MNVSESVRRRRMRNTLYRSLKKVHEAARQGKPVVMTSLTIRAMLRRCSSIRAFRKSLARAAAQTAARVEDVDRRGLLSVASNPTQSKH